MQKNTIIIGLVMLVVGGLIGCIICCSTWGMDRNQKVSTGMHMMEDGSMMGNDGMDMSGMMAQMNANLSGKTGDQFDKAFISEMIVHHQGAVEMAQLALTNAKHQEIKDLAKAIIAAQNKEIADMKAWQTNWYAGQ